MIENEAIEIKSLEMSYHTTGKVCIISLEGYLIEKAGDIFPEIKQTIDQCAHQSITNFILNLQQVIRVDSTGIGKLMMVFKTIEKMQGQVVLCQMPQKLARNFKEMRLDKIFKIYPTENEALKFLKQHFKNLENGGIIEYRADLDW